MSINYEKEVFSWGSQKPWDGRPRLKNGDKFDWTDIRTDGQGNVLSMPLLRGKPCFGRPEVFLRQGDSTQKIRNRYRKEIDTLTRCGRCPVRSSCAMLVKERVNASPEMNAALKSWRDDCGSRHAGRRVYTGQSGRFWTNFLKALANRGPFESSNDARLLELEEQANAKRRAKWAQDKRRARETDRDLRRLLRQPPSREFVANALQERNRRAAILESCAGDPNLPRSVSKILAAHARQTANITADAWLAKTILSEASRSPNPGLISRQLIAWGRNSGKTYATLKARVGDDLRRAAELERHPRGAPKWQRFDPDQDLDQLGHTGRSGPKRSEIEEILDDLDGW